MKLKILHALLIISSLTGYLEWGKESHTFLFQAEGEIISKLFADPAGIIHPFTILPFMGQLILLFTLFQKKPHKWLTYFGIASIGLLLVFMFIIGLVSMNLKIILSTLPFIIISIVTLNFARSQAS